MKKFLLSLVGWILCGSVFADNFITLVNHSSSCLCQDKYSAKSSVDGMTCFKTKQPRQGQSQIIEVVTSEKTFRVNNRRICASTITIAPESRKSVPIMLDSSGEFFVTQGNSIPDENGMCGTFLMRGEDRPIHPGDIIYVYAASLKEIDRSSPSYKEIVHYSPMYAFHKDCH